MAKTEVEHLLCLGDASYIGARETSTSVYYVECRYLERFGGQTYYYQRAVDTEEVEVTVYVVFCRDGIEYYVLFWACSHLLFVGRQYGEIGSEPLGIGYLRRRRGEYRYVCSHRFGYLYCQVSESAYAEYAHVFSCGCSPMF